MKRIMVFVSALALCFLSVGAASMSEISSDDRFASVLDAWNASNTDELWRHVWEYYQLHHPEDDRRPSDLSIRLGGTTDELIRDEKNWDLAIVSSKEVDLQTLADVSMLKKRAHVPSQSLASSQWLYPRPIQALLPDDPIWIYYIYCYDYDPLSNDATLLLCHSDNLYDVKDSSLCAEVMMDARNPEQIRNTEGIIRVGWTDWTIDDLLANPANWDVATVAIDSENDLTVLDQAGLLFDFSMDTYWLTRNKDWGVPNGFYSSDGRMIAIPYAQYANLKPDNTLVRVINGQCDNTDRAMEYAIHWMKSYEWMYDRAINNDTPADHRRKYGISLFKYDMDW